MVETSELLKVPAFAGLPDDQIAWFISQAKEMNILAGEIVLIPVKPGDVTGLLPFSRMKQFSVGAKSITDSRVLRFPSSQFPELVHKMPELAQRLVGLMSDRI